MPRTQAKRQWVSDEELVRLLTGIRQIALIHYPWPADAAPNDDRLVLALGYIGSLARKAIVAYERGEKLVLE